jgi:hypothetical protein
MADVAHEPALAVPAAAHAGPPPQVPAFDIVPRPAIPIVAVVLAGLIVAIATDKLWALEFFHVVGGAGWTVIDLFLGFVIGPIMGAMSIPARVELSARLMPKMLVIMPTLVLCTLAAGWQLAHQLGYLSTHYPNHGWVVASYIVVGLMATIALGFLEPANLAVLFELKKPRPNGERIARLMRIFIYTAGLTGAMQIATLVIMTKLASG